MEALGSRNISLLLCCNISFSLSPGPFLQTHYNFFILKLSFPDPFLLQSLFLLASLERIVSSHCFLLPPPTRILLNVLHARFHHCQSAKSVLIMASILLNPLVSSQALIDLLGASDSLSFFPLLETFLASRIQLYSPDSLLPLCYSFSISFTGFSHLSDFSNLEFPVAQSLDFSSFLSSYISLVISSILTWILYSICKLMTPECKSPLRCVTWLNMTETELLTLFHSLLLLQSPELRK